MEISKCMGCMSEFRGYPCPNCGYDPRNEKKTTFVLPPETIIAGKYLVGKVLGQGGFGVTYIGWDIALERKVAIKEYFPSGQVSRTPGTRSLIWSESEQARTARMDGMQMFLKEARKMAKLEEIPGVVKIRDLFQENETAYIVMDFVEGQTLKSILMKNGPMDWEQAYPIFRSAVRAMEKVHQAGLVHRDLSPDNLMLCPDGSVRILDLGAAKDLNINSGASSMQVAKGGFSPYEQYTQRGGSGPWSDVYSMAATIYYTLTGKLPPAATDRVTEDTIRWDLPGLQNLPGPTLKALKKAMAVLTKNRTQTMAELEKGLFAQPPKPKPKPKPAPKPKAKKKPQWLLPAAAVLVCGILAAAVLLRKPVIEPKMEAAATAEATEQTEAAVLSEEESRYHQAAEWEADGQLGRAAIAFGQLGDYQDANARSFAIWEKITAHETLEWNSTVAAIKSDGTVAISSEYPELEQAIRGWTDIVSLTAIDQWIGGEDCVTVVGLKSDGTVVTASSMPGYDFPDVDKWTQIVDIRAGYLHIVGLRSDGTVVAAGDNTYGQCDVEDWNGVIAIDTSGYYWNTVGLRYDGTVVAAGCFGWEGPDIQPYVSGWTDIATLETDNGCLYGLKTDGTVVCCGTGDEQVKQKVSGWTDIVSIDCGDHVLGIKSDGTVVGAGTIPWDTNIENAYGRLNVSDWTDITAVSSGHLYSVGLKADGTVVTTGLNRHGRCHVTDWTDIAAVWGGYDYTLGLKSDGTFVLAGQIIDYNNRKDPVRELLQWENIRIPTKPLPARNGHETLPDAAEETN